MSLQKFLSSIDLNEKTQKVYLSILKLVDAPASVISKHAGLERTTTYHQLEYLMKLGLVSTYRNRNKKRFVVENPRKIKGILEGKISLFEKYLPQLEKLTAEEKTINLRLYEGIEGMRQIIEEELNCREKKVLSIGYARDLRKVEGGRITFTERRLKKRIFSRCLRPKDDKFAPAWLKNQQRELREVRLLPDNLNLSGMIFIFDDKVTVITPEEEGMSFIIASQSYSKSMKTIFNLLWEISEKTQ